MNYYMLIYKLAENYLKDRGQYRSEHLEMAKRATEIGELILGGAMDDPADEAILIFRGETDKAAKAFAENDPYLKNGLIKEWKVRKWNAVIGSKFEG
ncbi:YciI-like protein [Christiangramia sp. SM2212]|uniref:YciI-like protein n=1 Tax=Christiangramia sediminicola TaxID=3073267 RepID=A0ABU1ELL6_9FLAO|nr:YciI-like protein [Christiangramia sp. SM2212]MDR5589257.1 YciI-like protein [Christiangramia sp. SM2212]